MTQDEIIELAKQAGLYIATDVNWMPIVGLDYAEKFAALVIANHSPQSCMTWQEGYEAGKQAEREALCQAMENQDTWDLYDPAVTAIQVIRARGQA